MENVVQLTDKNTVHVDEQDAMLIAKRDEAVYLALVAIGQECERHEQMMKRLHAELERQRGAYAMTVEVAAARYLKDPGQYDFRPELKAFVGVVGQGDKNE